MYIADHLIPVNGCIRRVSPTSQGVSSNALLNSIASTAPRITPIWAKAIHIPMAEIAEGDHLIGMALSRGLSHSIGLQWL